MIKQSYVSCYQEHSKPTEFIFKEIDLLKKPRLQTFANWPHFTPNRECMALNGWFFCQIASDRTICIYCNTICQNWTVYDDPYEVHARLAPNCAFIKSIKRSSSTTNARSETANQHLNEKFHVYHGHMSALVTRIESFNKPTWTLTKPSAESLAQAGFFNPGTGSSVTCFYCNGALHQWGENDNPTVEHARWFPHCTYARHLCGDRLYADIQLSKKKLSEGKQSIDNETLNCLVQARLDLPIVERLQKEYKLAIIKRCLEEQWKNNQDDFPTECDFRIACMILKKQIDIIDGKAEHITLLSQKSTAENSKEKLENHAEECLICYEEKRQLACMPCGHLCTCVSCGYALRACPVCREKIQSFVRIYC